MYLTRSYEDSNQRPRLTAKTYLSQYVLEEYKRPLWNFFLRFKRCRPLFLSFRCGVVPYPGKSFSAPLASFAPNVLPFAVEKGHGESHALQSLHLRTDPAKSQQSGSLPDGNLPPSE